MSSSLRTGRPRSKKSVAETPPPARDDPREEIASFERPPPTERADRPKRSPRLRGTTYLPVPNDGTYRPNRIDGLRCEFWSERAAIHEYLGGDPRWIAERMAEEDLVAAYERGEIE